MLWVFGVSYVTGVAISIICASNLLRLFAGKVAENELIDVHEEGMSEALETEQELAAQTAQSSSRGSAKS